MPRSLQGRCGITALAQTAAISTSPTAARVATQSLHRRILTGARLLIGHVAARQPGPIAHMAKFRKSPAASDRRAPSCWAVRIAIALAALWGVGAPCAASAQGVVKDKHGEWEMRCETPPGAAREQCALIQNVAAEDRPNVSLVVIVLKTADGKARLLRVIAPLGVLVPSGLTLKIDQTDYGRADFVRCLRNGCVAEVVMEQSLIDKMKSGHVATFIIFQTPEEGIGIPLPLAGFREGFDALP